MMARALKRWLREHADAILPDVVREVLGEIEKARRPATPEQKELARLLYLFGLRTASDSAREVAGRVILPRNLEREAFERKAVKIKWFWEWGGAIEQRAYVIAKSTREMVRSSVKQIIRDTYDEAKRPSAGEVARRIRTQWHSQGGSVFAFSSERAALIARTELAQAENTGIVAGYEATGVKEIEWLAYTDGRSGERHHEKMNTVRVKLGEKFTLPNGDKLRYPGDPLAPIRSTANCRCSTAPGD